MNNGYSLIIALVTFLIMGSAQADGGTTNVDGDLLLTDLPMVVYIGTNDYPVKKAEAATTAGISMVAYNLDAHRNLENHLTENLPSDMATAMALAEARFDALPQEDVKSIFQAVALTARWDIRKAPAFVFGNGEAVIYGLTDTAEALTVWRKWQQKRRRGR